MKWDTGEQLCGPPVFRFSPGIMRRAVICCLSFLMGFVLAIAPLAPSIAIWPPLKNHHQNLSKPLKTNQQIPIASSTLEAALHGLDDGRAYYYSGQYQQALQSWTEVAKGWANTGDRLHYSLALSYISLAHQALGEWPQAAETIAQSLTQLESLRTSDTDNLHTQVALTIQGQIFNTQGSLQFVRGELAPALSSWQQSAAFYQQAGETQRYVGSLINQGRSLHALGYFGQARRVLEQVKTTLDQESSPRLKVLGFHSLGDVLQAIGEFTAAQQVLQDGIAIAQAEGWPQAQAGLLISVGHGLETLNDWEGALKVYRQATALMRSPAFASNIEPSALQAQINEFGVLVKQSAWDEAMQIFQSLQPQLEQLSPNRTHLYSRINVAHQLMAIPEQDVVAAQLLAQTAQQSKAVGDRYAETYAIGYLGHVYEKNGQWAIAQDLTNQALAIGQPLDSADILYQWQWQLGRILKAQHNNPEAVASYKNAFQSLQSLRYDLTTTTPDQQFSFRESVEPVYREYVDLLLNSQTSVSTENLRQARDVIESLQLAELSNFFQSSCLEGQAIAIDEVDQTDVAVIYPIILSDRLDVIVSLPNQPLRRHTVSIVEAEVNTTLDNLLRHLTRPFPSKMSQTLGQELYAWLVKPVAADLEQAHINTLVFVLDGRLRSVPMAAMHDGDRYLIESYSMALTPGLQLINPQPLRQQGINTLAAGLTEARHGFSALANVEAELDKVEDTVPSRILLNQDFTSETFQTQVQRRASPIVHLATHGQFSSNVNDTFILAWDKPINVNELSAILQTGDQNRRTPVELLILSACQTATGDRRAALGLAGVAVQAGARSTLASLWSLDDESAAKLIGHLYEELANVDISKAEALRRAQIHLLRDADYRAPVHWAAFVLVGNWL